MPEEKALEESKGAKVESETKLETKSEDSSGNVAAKLQSQLNKALEQISVLKSEVDRKETVICGYQKQSSDQKKQLEDLSPVVEEVMTQLSANVDKDVLELLEGKSLADRFTWLKKLGSKVEATKPRESDDPTRGRPIVERSGSVAQDFIEAQKKGIDPVRYAITQADKRRK